MTVLEVLAVFTITSVLLGLLLPALNSARESARRIECSHHLRQIGIALCSYHEISSRLPAGWRADSSEETAFAWAASILPYLGERNIAARCDFQSRIDSNSNAAVRRVTPAIFVCPSDIAESSFALFDEEGPHGASGASSTTVLVRLPRANYVGVFGTSDPDAVPGEAGEGAFLANRFLRFAEFRRGLSHTLLVGERTARKLPATWFGVVLSGEDAPGRVVGNANRGPNRDEADECEFASRHLGGVNFLWADGHVALISDTIDAATYRCLARRY